MKEKYPMLYQKLVNKLIGEGYPIDQAKFEAEQMIGDMYGHLEQ